MATAEGTAEHERVRAMLFGEWDALQGLLEQLDDAEWDLPTDLPAWDVRDNVAHVIGIEATLAGDPQPPAPADLDRREHVRNELGAANEAWVESMRGRSPAEVLERFRDVTARRREQLAAMTAEDFAAPSWTPAGEATYGRFMQIRILDTWFHEQDIRVATGRPGNEGGAAAEVALDEVTQSLGYVVGKRAGAPQGAAVTFELTGPLQRRVHVLVDGRAAVVEGLDRPADAVLGTDSATFMRLAGGRTEARAVLDRLHLEGDVELASRIAASLGYMI